jgi:outer membrane protein OmpA-like peptidoglycan-associated protein
MKNPFGKMTKNQKRATAVLLAAGAFVAVYFWTRNTRASTLIEGVSGGMISLENATLEDLTLEPIRFEHDSDEITSESEARLEEMALRLTSDIRRLRITGHTDSDGEIAYNVRLGQARAEQVSAALVEMGVPRARIVAVTSAGEAQPIASNTTEEGKATNRRVEIDVV